MDPIVILGSDEIEASTGEPTQFPVRIRNRGRRVESFRVDLIGDVQAFGEVAPSTVSVLPGREEQVIVTITPPEGPETAAGMLRFGVRAVSEVDAGSSAVAEGRLALAGSAGVRGWVPEAIDSGRWNAKYRLELDNRGNAPVRLAIVAHDPSGELGVRVAPETIELLPGAPAGAEVRVKARRPFLRGQPVTRQLQVAIYDFPFGADRPYPGAPANPDDEHHQAFPLTFEQRPIVSKWVIAAVVLALAAVIAFVVLRSRSGSEVELELADPFTPTSFAVASQGSTSLFLSWDPVPNASSYQILQTDESGATVGDPVGEVEPPDSTTVVEGLEPTEQRCYKLVVLGPESTRSPATDVACGTTDEKPIVDPPQALVVVPEGDEGAFTVSWEYPPDLLADTQFEILVDNRASGDAPVEGALTTSIILEQRQAVYTVSLQVRAIRDGEQSDPTAPTPVDVPALPPVTTVPTADPDDGGGSGGGGGGDSGGEATTVPTTVATTTPVTTVPAEVLDVRQVAIDQDVVAWAILPAEFGGPVESQKQRLADAAGQSLGDVDTFTNRDTRFIEVQPGDLVPSAGLLSGDSEGTTFKPSTEFAFVLQEDPTAAAETCANFPTTPCIAATIRSAARTGVMIVPLTFFPRSVTEVAVDDEIERLREALPNVPVHVLDGLDWPVLASDQFVVYAIVEGPASPDIVALCSDAAACAVTTL